MWEIVVEKKKCECVSNMQKSDMASESTLIGLLDAVVDYMATDGNYGLYDLQEMREAQTKLMAIVGEQTVKDRQKTIREKYI